MLPDYADKNYFDTPEVRATLADIAQSTIDRLRDHFTQPEPADNDAEFLKRFKQNVLADVERALQADKHAALRAEYAKQVAEGTIGFYLWEYCYSVSMIDFSPVADQVPLFDRNAKYRCTDISCYVSKDGKPAIRILRREAQALQRQTAGTHDWFTSNGVSLISFGGATSHFKYDGTYTYRTKATIKLDGKMVTPEQAVAEWEAKKETHGLFYFDINQAWVQWFCPTISGFSVVHQYELRPKKQVWRGSRRDVLALLKEKGLL
jgi:hypothetical protein